MEIPAFLSIKLTEDEEKCERHFMLTHTRDVTGRYIIIRLPRKLDPTLLGDSKTRALNSLDRLFRKFSTNPSLQKLYSEFIDEYKNLGHKVKADFSDN